ncbi:hypothetical protein SFUMM280S_02723 [Streptomyces fumanus]
MAALLATAPVDAPRSCTGWCGARRTGEVTHEPHPARAAGCCDRGLLLPAATRTVVLPREAALHLRAGRAHRTPEPVAPVTAAAAHAQVVDATAAGQALAALAMVEELLKEWDEGGPAVLRAGGLSVRDLKRTAVALDVSEPVAAFWVELAYAAGLVASDGEADERYAATPAYDEWRELPAEQRWARLAEAWLLGTRTPGLVGGRDAKDRTLSALGPGLDRSAAPEVRHRVLALLARLPEGAAPDTESLLARLRWERPLRGPRRDETDDLRTRLAHWTLQEAELLGVTGRGALSAPGRALIGAGPAAPEARPGGRRRARRQAAGAQGLVGAGAMAQARSTTLILVTNTVSARQWKHELVKRTSLTEDEIGEYSGTRKEIRPVTIATYQVLTTRRKGVYPHLELFDSRDWGLIVYDEVHLLPAPVFKFTADLQARRRLGLTATLVREDGRESDVFSLIGPKRFDAPWKEIEAQGYIAPADCVEVRVNLTESERLAYATAEAEEKYRFLRHHRDQAEGDRGDRAALRRTADPRHRRVHRPARRTGRAPRRAGDQGRYVQRAAGEAVRGVPAGRDQRARCLQGGELLHRPAGGDGRRAGVGDVRLPAGGGAAARPGAAAQGGRAPGALLLGGRPGHPRPADFAAHRQRFLAEQGYAYRIMDADELLAES